MAPAERFADQNLGRYDPDGLGAFAAMVATTDLGAFERSLGQVLDAFVRYFDCPWVTVCVRSRVVWQGDLAGAEVLRVRAPGGAELEYVAPAPGTASQLAAMWAQVVVDTAEVVADRIGAAEELRRVATRDELTGVLSRSAFGSALAAWVREHPDRLVTVMYLDVDRLTAVNATYGSEAGDELIRQAAGRIREVLGEDALIGRTGGDEFGAVLPDLAPGPELSALTDRLQAAVQRPVAVLPGSRANPADVLGATAALDPVTDTADVVRSATIGVASVRAGPYAATELAWRATQAVLVGKRRGGARTEVYDESMRRADEIRGEVEMRLPKALAHDEFVLHYQPEVDLASAAVLGAEALVRWNHPTLGLLLPGTFIETVENSPYALRFGRWVLDHACDQWASYRARFGWPAEGMPRVRVNITPSQLMDADFADTVAATLRRSGLPGSGLGLEITERDVVRDRHAADRTLRGLAALGVTVAIDDFGTGYSSFGQLQEFKVSALKIDRRFVARMAVDPLDHAIVAAVLSLARSLSLEVVAEGVQDERTAASLVALGCRRAQGFLFSRPLPHDQLLDVLASGTGRGPSA